MSATGNEDKTGLDAGEIIISSSTNVSSWTEDSGGKVIESKGNGEGKTERGGSSASDPCTGRGIVGLEGFDKSVASSWESRLPASSSVFKSAKVTRRRGLLEINDEWHATVEERWSMLSSLSSDDGCRSRLVTGCLFWPV